MENDSNRQFEMQINLKEVLWDLLEQWKAIILVALAMAVLMTGAKFVKDSQAAKEERQVIAESEENAKLSEEERIDNIMESLDEEDKPDVLYTANRLVWLERQKEYITNSILMNVDSSNVRTLSVGYAIKADDADIPALEGEYDSFLSGQKYTDKIKPLIDSDAEDRYIGELIWTGASSSYVEEANYEDGAFKVQIILPDDTDADAVKDAVEEAFAEKAKALSKSVANHDLKMTGTEVTVAPNAWLQTNKGEMINRAANLQNTLSNEQNTMNEDQQEAVDEIVAIRTNSAEDESGASAAESTSEKNNKEDAEQGKAHLSKKYAVAGFVFGAMVYALVYIFLLMMRACVNYASDLENYTGARLLGAAYDSKEAKGIQSLLQSKFADRYRYRGLHDVETQEADAAETLESVCAHNGVKELTVLKMTDADDIVAKMTDASGLKTDILDACMAVKDKEIKDVKTAIIIADKETKLNILTNAVALCRDYGVNMLGCMFVGERQL